MSDGILTIRPAGLQDVEELAALESSCFSVPWPGKLLEDCFLNSFDRIWVLEEGERIAAYCNFRVIAGECELMRIAVALDCRGRGYARKLMEILAADARKEQAEAITLEVRASNLAAINLYKSYGFQIEAVRRRYYVNPEEDALIMWKRHV